MAKWYWTRLYSTNVLKRLNRKIRRRTDVVRVSPTDGSVVRLAGAIPLEDSDVWTTKRRYFSPASMERLHDLARQIAEAAPPTSPVRGATFLF